MWRFDRKQQNSVKQLSFKKKKKKKQQQQEKSFSQFAMIQTVKDFSIVHETEVDAFLEFPCFLYDPVYVGIWCLVPLPFLYPT